jgi:hypothetical protein
MIDLVVAQDRERVLRTAANLLTGDSPSDPLDALGLSFDPNGDDERKWRSWIEAALPVRSTGAHYVATSVAGAEVTVVPLPWHWPSPAHYGLPDHHCLERLAIDVLAAVYPQFHDFVKRWLSELRGSGIDVTWKSAIRMWNGAVESDTSGAGFYAKILGQNASTHRVLRERLPGTPLSAALDRFLR